MLKHYPAKDEKKGNMFIHVINIYACIYFYIMIELLIYIFKNIYCRIQKILVVATLKAAIVAAVVAVVVVVIAAVGRKRNVVIRRVGTIKKRREALQFIYVVKM